MIVFPAELYRQAVQADAPDVYWRASEVTASLAVSARDESGHNVNGQETLLQRVPGALSASAPNSYGMGKLFSVTGSCIAWTDSRLTAWSKSASFTVEMWLRNTAAGTGAYFMGNYNNITGKGSVFLVNNGTQNIGFGMTSNGFSTDYIFCGTVGAPKIDNSRWHHVVMTFSGSNSASVSASCVNWYVNGVPYPNQVNVGPGTITNDAVSALAFYIGQRGTDNSPDLSGSCYDEFAFYSGKLLPYERILYHYNLATGGAERYAATVLNDKPLMYWRASEQVASQVARDDSGNGRTGTITAFGFNQSGSLSGSANPSMKKTNADTTSVIVWTQSIFDFESTASFSVEFWSKNHGSGLVTPISKGGAASTYPGWWIVFNNPAGAQLSLVSNITTNNYIAKRNATPIADSNWHHIVATYDGSKTAAGVHIYIDGTEGSYTVDMDGLTGTMTNGNNLVVGYRGGDSGLIMPANWQIDELAIYNYVLTSTQVDKHYKFGVGLVPT